MAEHITSGHGDSSAISLRNKLRSIRQHVKAIPLSNFVRSLRHKFRSTPTEADLLLLICSIFSDDFRIPFEDLVVYTMGLGLLEDVHDLFAARSRVHDIISIFDNRKHSGKAIAAKTEPSYEDDGPENRYEKMLAGARDLGKSVALIYSSEFCRETIVEKWPESNKYKGCYGLSFVLKKVNEHSIRLECPNIGLLQLQYSQSLPIDFFQGLKQLRVLALDAPSLPQALNVLRNLRTLRLKVTKFEDTSSIGGLVNLEFLSISSPSLIEIPREIGLLENLKLLDLRRLSITYFPPGVLSRLLKLEELYLPLKFKNWGCKAKNSDGLDEFGLEEQDGYVDEDISDQERINANLNEIVSPLLNTLQVCVPKASVLPKSSPLFKKLREFRILKPNNFLYQPFGKHSVNVLPLR